jgi:HPt (histidine-containing phosphotransfer) domain-containing protein
MSTSPAGPTPLIVEWPRLLQLRELQPPGEPDILLELIGDFLTDSDRRIKLLHEAAAVEKWREVGHQAHTIKGMASLLACEPLRDAAETVETAVRTGVIDGLPGAIATLAAALASTRVVLSNGPPPENA